MIINSVYGIISTIIYSCNASVGNLCAEGDKPRAEGVFQTLDFINFWISFFCGICLYRLMNPFISLVWGEKYLFSQNMMAYNTFLNVVYPIYTRRQYIRHNTPGRLWDCLYTWDSGFIGMGLATADFRRAYDCLNTYLTPVGDRHSPYMFHGSVVPTQIFLYKYLFDRFPEHRDELKSLFPMVMQYYHFYSTLSGEEHQMKSGMLKTWHMDYNSKLHRLPMSTSQTFYTYIISPNYDIYYQIWRNS